MKRWPERFHHRGRKDTEGSVNARDPRTRGSGVRKVGLRIIKQKTMLPMTAMRERGLRFRAEPSVSFLPLWFAFAYIRVIFTVCAPTALLATAFPATAAAQHSAIPADSARLQIQSTLRGFYFNLAHRDWEALTDDILSSKVLAHRTRPRLSDGPSAVMAPLSCPVADTVLVDRATITLQGDWADVSVRRCIAGASGLDWFRLIHFDGRWRFTAVQLVCLSACPSGPAEDSPEMSPGLRDWSAAAPGFERSWPIRTSPRSPPR
jgi:hypothetical protein